MRFTQSKKIQLAIILPLLCVLFYAMAHKLKEWRYWDIVPRMIEGKLSASLRPDVSPTVTGSYLAGYVAQRRNQVDDAATYYSRALKASSVEPDLIVFQSAYKSLLLAGKTDQAVEYAKTFHEREKNSLSAMLMTVNDLIKQGEYQRAKERLQMSLSNEKGEALPLTSIDVLVLPYITAWMDVGLGKAGEERKKLDAALGRVKLLYLFTNYQRALMWDLEGKQQQAYDAYKRATGQLSLPYHLVVHAGNLMERMDKWDEAKGLYERYNQAHPQNGFFDKALERVERKEKPVPLITGVSYGVAEVLLEASRMLMRSSYAIEGLAYAQLALYLEPTHVQAGLLVAQSMEMLKVYDVANKVYANISETSGVYSKAQLAIARNLFLMGEKEEAFDALDVLLSKETKETKEITQILLTMADLYRQDKQFKKAASYYQQAVEKLEEDTSATWQNYFAAGIAHERAGNWTQAEKYLKRALDLQPERPEVLNYLGYSWIDRNMNIEEGKVMIEKALSYSQDDPHILDSMGWAYYLLGAYDKAVIYLEKAVQELPYDPVLNEHLGDIYWKVGRKNEAYFQWKKSLDYPDGLQEQDIETLEEKLKHGFVEE